MVSFLLPPKEVFSVREASRLLKWDKKTLQRHIRDGYIRTVPVEVPRVVGGPVIWQQLPRSEVERLAHEKGLL